GPARGGYGLAILAAGSAGGSDGQGHGCGYHGGRYDITRRSGWRAPARGHSSTHRLRTLRSAPGRWQKLDTETGTPAAGREARAAIGRAAPDLTYLTRPGWL